MICLKKAFLSYIRFLNELICCELFLKNHAALFGTPGNQRQSLQSIGKCMQELSGLFLILLYKLFNKSVEDQC